MVQDLGLGGLSGAALHICASKQTTQNHQTVVQDDASESVLVPV